VGPAADCRPSADHAAESFCSRRPGWSRQATIYLVLPSRPSKQRDTVDADWALNPARESRRRGDRMQACCGFRVGISADMARTFGEASPRDGFTAAG